MPNPDVIVIGGGPAGAAAATLLARAGVRVLVLERETFPRFHVGEALAPASMRVCKSLGVLERMEGRYAQSHGVRFLCSRTQRAQTYAFAEAPGEHPGYAFQVPRADFDDLLLCNAAAAGAEVMQGWRAMDAHLERGAAAGVRARDAGGRTLDLRARLLLDASGAEALMASRLCTRRALPLLDKTALYSHFAGVPRQSGRDEGNTDVITFPHGWVWSVPFRGGLNSVGMVCSARWMRARRPGEALEQFFDRTAQDSSWARQMLSRATRISPVGMAAGFSFQLDTLGGDGWLALGDATGFVDPLFSGGVHTGLLTAERAASEALAALEAGDVSAWRWAGYERWVRQAQALAVGVAQAFYEGALHDEIFDQAKNKPFRALLGALIAGDVFDPESPWVTALRERYPTREA